MLLSLNLVLENGCHIHEVDIFFTSFPPKQSYKLPAEAVTEYPPCIAGRLQLQSEAQKTNWWSAEITQRKLPYDGRYPRHQNPVGNLHPVNVCQVYTACYADDEERLNPR